MARAAVYAMIQMGCRQIFIYNRTIQNAENVARHFNSWASGLTKDGEIVRVLKSKNQEWPAGFRQPTMIVSCVPAASVVGERGVGFEMPLQWLGSPTGGVVADVCFPLLPFPIPFTPIWSLHREANAHSF
jgi:shikimate 5-dehydrogenase